MNGSVSLDLLLDICLRDIENGAEPEQCLARYPQWRAELEPMLHAALRLRKAPRPEPSPEVIDRIWANVAHGIEETREAGVTRTGLGRLLRRERPSDWSQPPRRYSMSGIAATVALVITLVGGSGLVYASQDAMPGQTLYQVREAVESARLQLSAGEEARLQLRLELAGQRLQEAERAMGQGGEAGTAAALRAYSGHLAHAEQIAEGFRGAAQESDVRAHVQEHLQQHDMVLERLHQRLSDTGQAGEALRHALENAHRLEERWQDPQGESEGAPGGSEGAHRAAGPEHSVPPVSPTPRATDPAQHREQERHEEGAGEQHQEQHQEGAASQVGPSDSGSQPTTEAQPDPGPRHEEQQAGAPQGSQAEPVQDRQQDQQGDQEQQQDRTQDCQTDCEPDQSPDQQQDQVQAPQPDQQHERQQDQTQSPAQEQQQQQDQAHAQSPGPLEDQSQEQHQGGSDGSGGDRH